MSETIGNITDAVEFSLNDVYHLLLRRIWLICGCVVFFLGCTNLYLFTATPKFDATATIEVLQRQHQPVNVEGQQPDDYRSLDVLETVEGNLERPSLLLRVLSRPEVKNNVYLARLAADPEGPENLGAFKGLLGSITAKLRRATRLIDITVEHSDPETAQMLANLLVEEYIQEGYSYQSGDYQNTSQYLLQESQQMKDKLEVTETELQDYAKLVDLRQRILDERKELDLLNERYLEKHPKIIEAHALLAELQKEFIDEMERRKAADPDPQNAVISAAALPGGSNLTDDEKVEREMVEEQSHYNILTQEEATERTMYESVLDRLKEAGISQGYQDADVRLREPAMLPRIPAKPRIFVTLAIGLFLGLVTGVGATFMLSSMDSSFGTIDEAEGRLRLPALGAIPELASNAAGNNYQYHGRGYRTRKWVNNLIVKEERKAMLTEAKRKLPWKQNKEDRTGNLVIKDNRDSMVAEAVRSLRAAIKLQGRHEERKTFLLTSAIPSEGKSFIVSNLATALAQEGSRVLLIDADLRKPAIHQILGCPG
jgi:succinoglycan biosynthesis transport protein ExoP